jgi:hypothetical protein
VRSCCAVWAEPDGFVAQQLTGALVDEADLTLTMTRAHRRAVLGLAPRALARTFTVREAGELVASVKGDAVTGADVGERFRSLVRGLADARSHRGRPTATMSPTRSASTSPCTRRPAMRSQRQFCRFCSALPTSFSASR